MQLVSLRLPEKLLKGLDKRAKKLRCNRSQLVRKILEEALLETPSARDEQFEQLRTELLMAVGQVGASVKEIPRFIRTATESTRKEIGASKAQKTTSRLTRDQVAAKAYSDTSTPTDGDAVQVKHRSDEKWSYAPGAHTAPLRPRLDTIHDPSENMTIEAEVVNTSDKSATATATASTDKSAHDSAAKRIEGGKRTTDRRAPRSDNQLAGLAIGDERRQSIRLARVLVFKRWDANMLSERFKLPLEHIEKALAGQGDLASLKVEALLATWEDEMLVSGWSVPTTVPKN